MTAIAAASTAVFMLTSTARPSAEAAAARGASAVGARRAVEVVRLSATGDITLGRLGSYPSGGAGALLLHARPHLHGDVVLGNLETVLGSTGSSKCGAKSASCYSFRAPGVYAKGLRRSGYTVLNLANNHANDYGVEGRSETIAALGSAGLAYTGTPGQIAYLHVRDTKIAVIGFAPYPWAQNLLDLAGAKAIVRRAARHAELVVVTMHAGAEGLGYEHVRYGMETYLGEQRGDPVRFAHAVVDAGADIVVGHGPHVLRAIQWYHGRLIAYSLGNFSGYRTLSTAGELGISAILHVSLRTDGQFVTGNLVPLRLLGTGTPSHDAAHEAWRLVSRLSRSDFAGAGASIGRNGAIEAPRANGGGWIEVDHGA